VHVYVCVRRLLHISACERSCGIIIKSAQKALRCVLSLVFLSLNTFAAIIILAIQSLFGECPINEAVAHICHIVSSIPTVFVPKWYASTFVIATPLRYFGIPVDMLVRKRFGDREDGCATTGTLLAKVQTIFHNVSQYEIVRVPSMIIVRVCDCG